MLSNVKLVKYMMLHGEMEENLLSVNLPDPNQKKSKLIGAVLSKMKGRAYLTFLL